MIKTNEFESKTVLVTGVNNFKDIGAKTALEFCKAGANVVMVYKRI